MKKYVNYYRVSSKMQGADGLGMGVQKQACENHVKNNEGTIIAEFIEVASGWRGRKQIELQKAVEFAKKSQATLLVYKIDRLGRKAAETLKIIDDKELMVEIVTMPTFNRLHFGILSLIAEHESAQISERTKAAHKVRIERKGDWVRNANANMVELSEISGKARRERWLESNKEVVALIKKCPECTPTSLANYLNDNNITTSGGKPFTASHVIQYRKRIERSL